MRKSNKILAFVACLVLLTALVIGLVACDPAPSQHQHQAVDEWSSDANGHWHACVEDDDAKLDSAEHTFGEWLIDNDNKHYKKCSTCQYETAHEAHNLTINADKTKFTCECGYSEDHTHQLGNLIQDGANGHYQACTTEGCGYVTATTNHELSINADKTAFTCECGYSEAHSHQLGNPINDGTSGHHQACETEGCGYVTATGNHSLQINSDYTKYECECGYSENHTHTLVINEDKTKFTCTCGYSENHSHDLGELTPDGATGHYKECQTQGCGYRETDTHTLTINDDKTAFECECGYSEAHSHKLGNLINDNADGHHQACETQGCGYVTEKSKHELTINDDKTAFECECGYSEAHSHTFGALVNDEADGHHKDCTADGCGYRETSNHTLTINDAKDAFTCECGYSEEHEHKLGALKSDGKEGHHQECETEGCGYIGEQSNHSLKINADKTAFECECGYSEEHEHQLGALKSDGKDGHHQECETDGCGYVTATDRHSLKINSDYTKYECECGYSEDHTHELTINDEKTAFECECGYSEKHEHQLGALVNDEADGHHKDCQTPGCGYKETAEHDLKINDAKDAFTCECGYSEKHEHKLGNLINDNADGHHQACETQGCGYVTEKSAHELTINEDKTAFTCECGYSEAHSHTLGELVNDGAEGHHKDCTAKGCGYKETNTHTLTINEDKTAFECECGYSEKHEHQLGSLINDNAEGHHQECETKGCGYIGDKTSHDLKINADKTAFECECGYSEEHEHQLGAEYISDGVTGHHQKCTTDGCGYETTPVAHDLQYVEDEGENTHHATCNGCDYVGESVVHTPGEDATKVDDNDHAFKCTDCGADVKEAHRTKLVADAEGGTHHTECEVCDYKSESEEHAQQGELQSDEKGHFYLCLCGAEVNRQDHTEGEAYGHDEDNHWKLCETCGYALENTKTAHTPGEEWQQDAQNNKHYKLCTVCNERVQEGEHVVKWVQDSATKHHSECEVCAKSLSSSASHTYGSYEKVDNTNHKRICTKCQYEQVAKHSTMSTSTSTACTNAGDDGHTYQCTNCKGDVLVAHTLIWYETADKTMHYEGCKFTKCGYIKGEPVAHTVPETGIKQFTSTAKEAMTQYHTFTCSVCSKTDARAEHTMVQDEGGIDYCSACDYSIWVLELKGDVYSVVGYNGTGDNIDEITLPTSFKGTPITMIGGKTGASLSKPVFYNVFAGKAFTITKLVIPEGYTDIGLYAFNNTIESLYLPASLENLANNAFTDGSGNGAYNDINNVYFADFDNWLTGLALAREFSSPFFKGFTKSGTNNRDYRIEGYTNVFALQDGGEYKPITEITFDDDLSYIGPYALAGANITKVTFNLTKDSDIYISAGVFYETPIEKIYVSSIDDYATKVTYGDNRSVFAISGVQCYLIGQDTPIEELTFGAGVTEINDYTFRGAHFKKLTLPATLQNVNKGLLDIVVEEVRAQSVNQLIKLNNGQSYQNSLWASSPNAKLYIADVETRNIVIDDAALEGYEGEVIGGVFANCDTIDSVTFSNTKDIGLYQTFYHLSNKSGSVLASVTFGDHITSLVSAFDYNLKLTGELRLSKATTSVTDFTGCTGLTVIYLPAGLTTYGSTGFGGGMTAKLVFHKDTVMEKPFNTIGQSSAAYKGTEVVLPGSLTTLMTYTNQGVSKYDMLYYAASVKRIYFGGTRDAWQKLMDDLTVDAIKTRYQQMDVLFMSDEEYPGDDLAATGKYWYYNDEGNTAIWMKGHSQKDGKYLMFDETTYYVNIDAEETSITLTPLYCTGEAIFSGTTEGITVTETGVVTTTVPGKYTVKAEIKDSQGIATEVYIIAYTNTYYLTGTLGGAQVEDKQDDYTLETVYEHAEYAINASLKSGDSFKIYAKGSALAKTDFDEANSAGAEVISVGDDGTVTVAKDAKVKITVKVTDGNKYQFVIEEQQNLTVAIQGRKQHYDYGVAVSESIPMPGSTTTVILKLTGQNLIDKGFPTSWPNIGFSVTLPDGTQYVYDGTQSDKVTMSGAKYGTSGTGKWRDQNANTCELWYEGTIKATDSWTFTFTINNEGKITACEIK